MKNKRFYKRFFLSIFTLFFSATIPAFADSKNILFNQDFDAQNIDTINISLIYEDLKISQVYGDEITVEIGSNNLNKIPEIICQDGTFIIKSKEQKVTRGNKCTVYLYLPENLSVMSVSISNVSGNIQADLLKARNSVIVGNISGRTDIAFCSTELFNASSTSGNITLQKVTADYFTFGSTSGNIFVELQKAPLASSKITNISGKSQLYYPKNSDFDIAIFSVSGSIKSQGMNSPVSGSTYTQSIGHGGPEITISSISGKIEFREY